MESIFKELFLNELSQLSKKYNIYISGCGCCGSPFLTNEEPEYSSGYLIWNKEKQEYYYE